MEKAGCAATPDNFMGQTDHLAMRYNRQRPEGQGMWLNDFGELLGVLQVKIDYPVAVLEKSLGVVLYRVFRLCSR